MEVDSEPIVLDTDIEHIAADAEKYEEVKDENGHHDVKTNTVTASRPATLFRTITARSFASTRSIDPGPPPDGGRAAWTQTACAHLTVASSWGFVTSFGAFQTYYTTDLGLNASDVSWIGSIQTTLLFLIGVAAGRAMDAGYFKLLLCVGATTQVVGVMCLSVARQYYALLLTQGLTFGLGAGLVFTPAMYVSISLLLSLIRGSLFADLV